MINRLVQLENISAMPAANTAGTVIIEAPRGYKYKNITLKLKTNTNVTFPLSQANGLHEIQARMGGGIQRRADAVRIDAINTLNGAAFASQVYGVSGTDYERHLTLHFEEPWRTRVRTNSVDPNALGWKTGWLPPNKPLQIALSIAAMGAGIAPVITAEAEITDDDDGQPNPIMRWNTDFANINGSLVNIPNLDNGLKPDDRIEQISIFDGTTIAGTLATIRMEVGSVVVKQDQILRALTSELRKYGMDPASSIAIANAAHLVFDKNDALDDTLPVGFTSSLLKLTYSPTSPTGTLPYITQILGSPNRS